MVERTVSDKVTPLPVKFRHRRTVEAKEIGRQPKPSNEMIWEICPYLTGRDLEPCDHCPAWEEDLDHGKVYRLCFGLAEEVCKIIFAVQKRQK
jgi:hypothetical protein